MTYYTPYNTQMLYYNYNLPQNYAAYYQTVYPMMRDGSLYNQFYAVDGGSEKTSGAKIFGKVLFSIIKIALRVGLNVAGAGDFGGIADIGNIAAIGGMGDFQA